MTERRITHLSMGTSVFAILTLMALHLAAG